MARIVAWAVRTGRGRWLALILLATVSLPIAFHQYFPFARARSAQFDLYQTLLPRTRLSGPATIVAIDEAALKLLGQWPWARTDLAKLIEYIGEQSPLAIGLDMLLPEPDQTSPESLAGRLGPSQDRLRDRLAGLPAYDALLSETLARHRIVLGAAGFNFAAPSTSAGLRTWPVATGGAGIPTAVHNFPYVLSSLPSFQAAAFGQGLLNAEIEHGIVRRIPMISGVASTLVPAFALELLRVAMRVPAVEVEGDASAISAMRVGDVRVPTQPDGTLWLHFSPFVPERYVSAADVLGRRIDPAMFKDKIVIVALTGLGVVDFKTTPRGEYVPGAEVHAQLIETFFDGRFLLRPRWAPWLELALLVSVGGVLIAIAPRLRRDPAILLALGLLALVVALGIGVFHWYGLLFDALTLGIALAAVFSSLIASALVRADNQRRSTERSLQLARESAAHISGELEAARRIQLGILPSVKSSFPAERRFELAAAIEPARAVGGDLYDFFMLDSNRLFVMIGDVSGKGVPASLLMATSKALIKSIALRPGADIARMLSQANIEISRDNPQSQFVTAFAAEIDVQSGALRYWTAGHDTPFVRDESGVRQIDGLLAGPPLCVLEQFEYREQRVHLKPGAALVLFTDGITEAEDVNGERFSKERVAHCLEHLPREATADAMLEALRAAIGSFVGEAPASDDLTLLVVRWLGPTDTLNAR